VSFINKLKLYLKKIFIKSNNPFSKNYKEEFMNGFVTEFDPDYIPIDDDSE
jgi:hypothetical protein